MNKVTLVLILGAVSVSSLAFAFVLKNNKEETSAEVVEHFAQFLADGECEDGLKLTTGKAYEMFAASIDAGCEPYETDIVTVTCESNLDTAWCNCKEIRSQSNNKEPLKMTFLYTLLRVNENWKISYYEKDVSDIKVD